MASPLLDPPNLEVVVVESWKDWTFDGKKKTLVVVHSNVVHHKLVEDRAWSVKRVWELTRVKLSASTFRLPDGTLIVHFYAQPILCQCDGGEMRDTISVHVRVDG